MSTRNGHRNLIVNADDFGACGAVNRAVIDCHSGGVVTSASLMVTGAAAAEAAALSHEYPSLSIGLHWDVSGEDERWFDLSDERGVREEFARQLDAFEQLTGRHPTHVDSHRHVHKYVPYFCELVEPLGVPVRGDGRIKAIGGFYAQWELQVTNLEYVRVPFLQRLIHEEVHDGWTEISCHPGYVAADYRSVYLAEREVEVRTLTDPRVRVTLERLGIELANYNDFARRSALERA